MSTNTEFDHAVSEVIHGLARGEVVSYGWVATVAGFPGRQRAVGAFLAAKYDGPNWWLVVAADGRLRAPNLAEQERRLRVDGVRVEHGRVAVPVKRP
jgi:methylated-DNA-protein-cysteine methyltransferase-like protein